jgi:hypothetical protein
MICCSSEEKILGMVRVDKQDVINSAEKTLKNIYRSRSKYRRQYVRDYLASAIWYWKYIWRWIGFRKPTRRDALSYYYNGGTVPPHFTELMMFHIQENQCNKIIKAANATRHATMWISLEGADSINL